MVSTRKKRQSNRSQIGDFDQGIIFGNSANERQENTIVKEGTGDRDFTVGTSNSNLTTNENAVNVKTLERFFKERNDGEMSDNIDTLKIISKTQFWPLLIVLLLLRSISN